MKKKSLYNWSFLVIVLVLLSCSEDTGEGTDIELPETKQSQLVGKIWKLNGLTVDPPRARVAGGAEISDWYGDMPSCEKDDQKIYFFNGNLIFDEGPSRCDDASVQTFTGSWTFNSDETILTELKADFVNIIFSFDIIEINESELVLERTENFFGTLYTFRESYVSD